MAQSGDTEEWAASVLRALERAGVQIAPGLDQSALDDLATAFNVELPGELAVLLAAGVPVGEKWPSWANDPAAEAQSTRRWIRRAFEFDIRGRQYWHPLFGGRPDDDTEALDVAMAIVETAPTLIPIYAHRFLVAGMDAPRPVLSVWQAVDSIYFGNDLADYLANEFGCERPEWAVPYPPHVPVWNELFDLLDDTSIR